MKRIHSLENRGFSEAQKHLKKYAIEIVGHFTHNQTEKELQGVKTILLIGPSEPVFLGSLF